LGLSDNRVTIPDRNVPKNDPLQPKLSPLYREDQ